MNYEEQANKLKNLIHDEIIEGCGRYIQLIDMKKIFKEVDSFTKQTQPEIKVDEKGHRLIEPKPQDFGKMDIVKGDYAKQVLEYNDAPTLPEWIESMNKKVTEWQHAFYKSEKKVEELKNENEMLSESNKELSDLEKHLRKSTSNAIAIARETNLQQANEQIKALKEFKQSEKELPNCYQSGEWDGKRSDFHLVKDKDGKFHVARMYGGFMDGSEFAQWYDTHDFEVNDIIEWQQITT